MQDIDANLLPIKTGALGSKAKIPMFSALVSAGIAEFGDGMSGWDDRRRGDIDETFHRIAKCTLVSSPR